MYSKKKFVVASQSHWIVFILLFFFIDEVAFILYNISFFQFMCANTLSLFFNDEIPTYINAHPFVEYNTFYTSISSFTQVYIDVPLLLSDLPVLEHTSHPITSTSIVSERAVAMDLQTTYYKLKLEATNVKKTISSFYPLQQYIYTIPGESSLIFYRLENKSDIPLQTLSVYVTTPAEAVAYIKKLQCFCYEELMVAPYSIIDLPILFSIDEEILNEEFKEITLNYILLLK